MSFVDAAVDELRNTFRRMPDKREAHRQSGIVLEQVSREPYFVREALERHVSAGESLNELNYPVVSVQVATNSYFTLVLNCWIPLPSRCGDVTTKAIHHHGNVLLSTATMFGPGYEHWMFSTPEQVRPGQYAMNMIEAAPHPLHHVAFVNSWICHVPFYPESLTITLALWSSDKPTSWLDAVKRVPLLNRRASGLRRLAASMGLSRPFDLKIVDSFDFYPVEKSFGTIKNRVEFTRGPNEDHLQSLFHVIQQTGNEHISAQVRRLLGSDMRLRSPQAVEKLASDLEAGRPIESRLSRGHYDVLHMNFTKSEIEIALGFKGGDPDAR